MLHRHPAMRGEMLEQREVLTSNAIRSISICFFVMFISEPAYAYIDPGSAGLLLQAIIGAIAAGAVALKIYWRRIVAFLSRRHEKVSKPSVPEGDS